MKRIIVCDSGLGGLDIAAGFCHTPRSGEEEIDLIFFNAWPDVNCGYNKLSSEEKKEAVFRSALEGMARFKPDHCLIACNTLSIVYERLAKHYTPPFPVTGIIDAGSGAIAAYLKTNPQSEVLILGTKTTVESNVYSDRLKCLGIRQERLHSLACPGLATLLEKDAQSDEVITMIRKCAKQAKTLFSEKTAEPVLALCCTHFGYASELWKHEFTQVFGGRTILLNPNEAMQFPGAAVKFRYCARIPLPPESVLNMEHLLSTRAPVIPEVLKHAAADPGLFEFTQG